MSCRRLIVVLCGLIASIPEFSLGQSPHRRFEYKYSFKSPYLAQKDNQVPFWTYSGNAIASSESLRITPSLRSQKGQAWCKQPTSFEWWEVEIVFRINGRGRVGADGLAFWFTTAHGVEGPVFGSSDKWNGLGIFFDSFDNDNKRNNPYVMAMINDGTKAYDHENDGMSQLLGGCLRDFRNKPHPVRAKIEYYKHVLTLMVHNGLTAGDKDYEICTRVEGVHLPTSGYFGLSAATGGLADDHDVLKFLVSSLRSPDELAAAASTDKEQEEQYQREFQQYQEKTQRARDEYVAANPDARKQHVDEDDEYEAADIRELRQIFTGQSQIYDAMRQLNAKMDEIIGRQERTLSLVGAVHSGLAVAGGGVPLPTGGAAPPPPAVGGASPISRFEVDSLINTQRDIAQTAKDVKNMVVDISQKSTQLLNKAGQPVGSAQPVGGAYDMHVTLKELNEGLNHIKHTLSAPGGQQQRGGVVEACPSCLSTWLFVGVALSQLICIIGYMMYRDNRDAQAKKFY
ncbi:protein ERGIC-53 isoform X3 [Hyalella azteca]|uniref:Protein ERGIC-53 isoform X3 n=1 Tax=Hyalella azteca TaxID=294128 RepID=A0A8B7NZN9_HYAAZ|nr:protein ERGIC-53 isoform X3 [Hyalella azteca]